ncbi:MAG: hypothetical protein KA778_07495 [Burkholderiaceae bacterium]|nr:hypothetical protein [Burkholderiaceae bacterium]
MSALLSAGLSGSTRLADSLLAVRSRAGSDGKSAGRWEASSRDRPRGGSALRISGGGAGAGVACATGGASAAGAAAVCGAVAVPVAVAPARGAFASGGAWRSESGDPNIRCTANKIAAAVPATEAIGQPVRQSRNARTQAGAAAARTWGAWRAARRMA